MEKSDFGLQKLIIIMSKFKSKKYFSQFIYETNTFSCYFMPIVYIVHRPGVGVGQTRTRGVCLET